MAAARKHMDDAFLVALACGSTMEAAARKAGISERTAHRRLKDPAFGRRLDQLKTETVRRAADMLTAAALEAVKTLLSLQADNVPAPVRLGAARATLELGMKAREFADLTERIAQLEARFAAA
jgi:hypothetical protein